MTNMTCMTGMTRMTGMTDMACMTDMTCMTPAMFPLVNYHLLSVSFLKFYP